MSMDSSELINKLESVNAAVTALTTAINAMSSKMPTPENMDVAVSAYSTKFRFYDISNTADLTSPGPEPTDNFQSLTQADEGDFYIIHTTDDKIYNMDTTNGDTAFTEWADSSGLTDPFICWDWTNEQMFAMDDTSIQTWSSSGSLLRTIVLKHTSWTVGDWETKAIAHDNTNDQLYAILWKSTTYELVYVKVNPITGAMTDDLAISEQYNTIEDAEIIDEKLYVLDVTNKIIPVYRLSEVTPYVVIDKPTLNDNCFSVDKDGRTWAWMDTDPTYISWRALSFVQRVSVEDASRATYLDVKSINVTTASLSILIANPSREGAIIFNSHATSILYVDGTTATTEQSLPVYPYHHIVIEGYTGGIYAIASAGTIAVKIAELS